MGVSSRRDGQIAQLASRQHGHVARSQLLAIGMAPSTIGLWVARGWLIPVFAGIYAVGYRRPEPLALAMAAVLAAGPGAVLSHDSALALWSLRRWPPVPEVIAPRRVRRPGVSAHRSVTLTRAQRTVWLGVSTTRAARAIEDMGRRLTPAQRIRLANRARLDGLATADEAERLLGHRRQPTRSGMEDAFQAFIERYDLPQPVTNARLAGREVDAFWPRQRVIVELDDYATHGDPVTFDADRNRDASHLELGIATLRLTRDRFSAADAERLRHILRAR